MKTFAKFCNVSFLLGVAIWLGVFLMNNPDYGKSKKFILCGGSSIPTKAMIWIRERVDKSNIRCLAISCYSEPSKRWNEFFDNVKYITPEELVDIDVKSVDVVFLDGGDQFIYLNRLDGKLLQKFYDSKKIIVATSASSMILSGYFFTAECGTISSEEAKNNPELVTIGSNFVNIPFLKDTIVDTHYVQRSRQERLSIFMQRSGAIRGIGIDESTALVVTSFGEQIVFGQGNVTFIEKGK